MGALNPQPVQIDLGFARAGTSLGVAVLVALLIGVIVGGLALRPSVVAAAAPAVPRRAEQAARTAAPRPTVSLTDGLRRPVVPVLPAAADRRRPAAG